METVFIKTLVECSISHSERNLCLQIYIYFYIINYLRHRFIRYLIIISYLKEKLLVLTVNDLLFKRKQKSCPSNTFKSTNMVNYYNQLVSCFPIFNY